MKYLTTGRNRGYKGYVQLATNIGQYSQLEVSVYYSKGGINYFTGATNGRGYKVSFTPCNVTPGAYGVSMVSMSVLGGERESGGYVTIESATRYNANRLYELAKLIDPLVPKIATAFEATEKNTLIALCKVGRTETIVAPVKPAGPVYQKSQMMILTKEIKEKLPKLYSQENKRAEEVPVVVKFFDPTGSWTWYATEGEPTGEIIQEGSFKGQEDYKFFGYVKGFDNELGYFTLGELSTAKGMVTGLQALPIERDRNFKGTLASVMAN